MKNKRNVTRSGKTSWTPLALDRYDRAARRELNRAKQSEVISVQDRIVHLKLRVRGTPSQEMQTLLRSLANIRKHGKAYAPTEVDAALEEVHHRIGHSREFLLAVRFDLETGDMTIDFGS
jgi:hypothetical protein